MLKKYRDQQQQALDGLGEERGRLRRRLAQETQRVEQLQALACSLSGAGDIAHPLNWSNRHHMHQQVQTLVAHQIQQVALATADLSRHEQQVLRQFGKVKGLDLILSQRAEDEAKRQQLKEQGQLDELNQQAWSRRHSTR